MNTLQKIKQIIDISTALLMVLLIILLPFVFDDGLMNGIQSAKAFCFAYIIMALFVIVAIKNILSQDNRLIIKPLDALLTIYFLYSVIHPWFFGYSVSIMTWVEMLSLTFFYVIVRQPAHPYIKLLLYAVLISGSVQAIYGNLQLFDVFASNHSIFNITGGFFNPGPYSGYLCAILPIAVVLYLEHRDVEIMLEKRITGTLLQNICLKYIPVIAIFSIAVVLPATRSRAAWFGVVVGLFIVVYANRHLLTAEYFARFNPLQNRIVIIIGGLLLVLLVFGLYHFKKDSADGRMLIWNVSMNMIADHPIWGHGLNGFEANYMNYQAAYFAPNTERPEAMVAGDTNYAFNEFIKLGVEKGIVGLLLAILILWRTFFAKSKEPNDTVFNSSFAAKVGLVSILAFAMFSYPSAILPIKMVFVLLLAIVATIQKPIEKAGFLISENRHKQVCYAVWIGSLGVCLSLVYPAVNLLNKQYTAYIYWKDASDIYGVEAYTESLEDFELAYPQLKTNGQFLVQYGKALEMAKKHDASLAILTQAKNHLNNTILYTALGNNYKALNRAHEAEQAYFHAYNMAPSRFYPLSLLATLYSETNQSSKAIAMAEKVLSKQVKIESSAIEEMKLEMKKVIEKQKHTQNRFNQKGKERKHNQQVETASSPAPVINVREVM